MDFRSRWCRVLSAGAFLTMLAAALLLSGCGSKTVPPPGGKPTAKGPRPYTVYGKTYQPLAKADGFSQEGVASWYGPGFHGRTTSNGERYDMEKMTAAHKVLPFDTYVKVHNLDNGREAVVRVNDRGPFVDGRVIDLSKAAAKKLGVVGPGTAHVRIEALGYKVPGKNRYIKPASYETGEFTVQVGAFVYESNAWRLAATLRTQWKEPVNVVRYDRGDKVFHRVRVGKLSRLDQAEDLQKRLRAGGFKQAFAVAW